MKRPLAILCMVSVIWMAVSGTAGKRTEDSPPFLTKCAVSKALAGDTQVIVQGTVKTCDMVSAGLRLSVNQLSIQKKDKSVLSLSSEYKITITTEQTDLLPGDRLTVKGEFAEHEAAGNPGEFDAQSYYLSDDVIGTLWEPEILDRQKGSISVSRMLAQLRRELTDSYGRVLGEKPAGTMAAISLGEKGLMQREWKTLYQEGGIAHIFAVSGLHVSLVGMGLFRFLRRLRCSYVASAVLAGAAVFLYGLMTGFGISAMRAVFMFFVWAGAQISGRKNDTMTAVALAAAVIVCQDHRNAGQSPFWLSFCAVLSVAALAPAVQELCGVRSRAGNAVLSGCAVWLGTLPCTLYFFYQSAPWSILLNLAVIPLMTILMISGLAASVAGLVSIAAGTFLAAPVHYLLALFEWLCRIQQRLPNALWVAGRPAPWRIVLYYVVLIAALQWGLFQKKCAGRKRKKPEENAQRLQKLTGPVLCIVTTVLCVLLMGVRPQRELQVLSLDVGQGDCALVRLPQGTNCLIDAGSTSKKKVWEYVISQSVKYYGAATLDYIFLSHADQDHINGAEEFLESYECGPGGKNVHGITVKHLVLPPSADREDFARLKELANEKEIEVLSMEAGDRITAKDGRLWEISCLAPDAEKLCGESNEDSMVLMLTYGRFRMLFTGDLEKEAEKRLAQSGTKLRADVLKVGHHGSAGASSDEFLEQVQPQVAVISCAKVNRYGHPSRETLKRLEDAGSRILQTPQGGAVMIRSNGRTFLADTFRKPIVLP
ncbi:MAG: DNA internalization-related competence protein ComEC/Rec2 [Lachnospiraceae bacterium]